MKAEKIDNYSGIITDKVCYWYNDKQERWFLYHPNVGCGDLSAHDIVVNEDGSITVSPSIMIKFATNKGTKQVHGYLTNGIWKDC